MMGTLTRLTIVFGLFCIGLTQGIKCYQCKYNSETGSKDKDEGCDKADKSYLKMCGAVDGKGGKVACLEKFIFLASSYEKRAYSMSRECSTEPLKDPATCSNIDRGEPGFPEGTLLDKISENSVLKSCTCYEDGCNNMRPNGERDASKSNRIQLARTYILLLLLLLLLLIKY